MTINNLNKFVVRHFEDQVLLGLKPIPDPGRGQDSEKIVTNPSLKAGVSGYTPYQGFSPDGTATGLLWDIAKQKDMANHVEFL